MATSKSIYPSPFFNMGELKSPKTIKEIFKWMEYYTLSDPFISSAIDKLAAYSITEIVYEGGEKEKTIWKKVLEDNLGFPGIFHTININFFTFGNVFSSLRFPLTKEYKCSFCKKQFSFESAKELKFTSKDGYKITCSKCNKTSIFKNGIKEVRKKSGEAARLLLWDPGQIDIDYYYLTGDRKYFYNLPKSEKNKAVKNDRHMLETTEQVYLEAAVKNQAVVFNNDMIYHMKRPSLTSLDPHWGYPLGMATLQSLYHLAIMTKSQEANLLALSIPFKYLYPEETPQLINSQPGLTNWIAKVKREYKQYLKDPNYTAVMPFPIGQGMIGGSGKALLLVREIEEWTKRIIAGLKVPQEFVFGGLQWSGTSISLRMLENDLMNLRNENLKFLNWVIKQLAGQLKLTPIKVHFTKFKMADDMQIKEMMLKLWEVKLISAQTLLAEFGLEPLKELEVREDELVAKSNYDRKEIIEQVKIQMDAEKKRLELAKEIMPQDQQMFSQGSKSPGIGMEQQGSTQQQKVQQAIQAPKAIPEQKPPRSSKSEI